MFLEEMQNISKSKYLYAIEPSKEMAEICRNKGLRVIENPIESVSSQEYQFDLLTSFELLEHLFDPYSFILSVFSLLKPGGHFVLTTPNGLGFDIANLWEKSKTIFPPHHLNFFNPSSLHKLFSRAGFQEIEVTTPGKLDWEIVEKAVEDAPRFFSYLSKYGSPDAKRELQSWITKYNFSSHMHVVARKPLC